jgi:hypothetical protein
MQSLKIHIEYLDGRPAEDQEMPARYAPGEEKVAVMQMLGAINTMGVIIFDADGATLIPISSIKSVKVSVPSVVTANTGDLLAIEAQTMARKAVQL